MLACALLSALAAVRAQATFPGRNGKVVLVRSQGNGLRQLYIGTRSGDLRLLSRGLGFAAGPDFSPNGRRVVFRGRRSGVRYQQIFSIRPDGTGLRQLTNHPTDSLGPAFGANGRFVLYDLYGPDGSTLGIWKLSLRTGRTWRIVSDARSAAVSPKGQIFAYVKHPGRDYTELFTARVDGTRFKRLTHERYFAEQPDFSPNGRWIVYRTLRPCRGRGYRNALAVTNPTGTKTRTLLRDCNEGLSAPVFSPDGDTIVFFRNGVARTISFPRVGRVGHLLRDRPNRAIDSNIAWQPR